MCVSCACLCGVRVHVCVFRPPGFAGALFLVAQNGRKDPTRRPGPPYFHACFRVDRSLANATIMKIKKIKLLVVWVSSSSSVRTDACVFFLRGRDYMYQYKIKNKTIETKNDLASRPPPPLFFSRLFSSWRNLIQQQLRKESAAAALFVVVECQKFPS